MENKITTKHTKNLHIEGKDLKAVLTSYINPIKESDRVQLYTKLEIGYGEIEWGHAYFEALSMSSEDAEKIFDNAIYYKTYTDRDETC